MLFELYGFNNLAVKYMFFLIEVINIRIHSHEMNKLRNIYTIGRGEAHLHQDMGNLVFQNLNHPVYHKSEVKRHVFHS